MHSEYYCSSFADFSTCNLLTSANSNEQRTLLILNWCSNRMWCYCRESNSPCRSIGMRALEKLLWHTDHWRKLIDDNCKAGSVKWRQRMFHDLERWLKMFEWWDKKFFAPPPGVLTFSRPCLANLVSPYNHCRDSGIRCPWISTDAADCCSQSFLFIRVTWVASLGNAVENNTPGDFQYFDTYVTWNSTICWFWSKFDSSGSLSFFGMNRFFSANKLLAWSYQVARNREELLIQVQEGVKETLLK